MRTRDHQLVVELQVAEGVLPVVSLGDGYPINLDTITIQNNLSGIAFLVLPNLGDRNIASLMLVLVTT